MVKEGSRKKYYYNGGYYTLSEISRLTGLKNSTLRYRLSKGNWHSRVAFTVAAGVSKDGY